MIFRGGRKSFSSGGLELGNYEVVLSEHGKPSTPWRTGHVKHFERLEKGVWELLYLALDDALRRQYQAPSVRKVPATG